MAVQNYKKRETAIRLKKFYGAMSQAILLSEAVNGPSVDWELVPREDPSYGGASGEIYFQKYIAPYLKYVKTRFDSKYKQFFMVYFEDGSIAYVSRGDCIGFIYDVNGNKKPNKEGCDKFGFFACPARMSLDYCNGRNFCPAGVHATRGLREGKREALLNLCKNAVPHLAHYCAALIEYDNWEFKDDYPRKL